MAAPTLHSTKASVLMRAVFTPARRAARSLAPMAKMDLPSSVLRSIMTQPIISATEIHRIIGKPSAFWVAQLTM